MIKLRLGLRRVLLLDGSSELLRLSSPQLSAACRVHRSARAHALLPGLLWLRPRPIRILSCHRCGVNNPQHRRRNPKFSRKCSRHSHRLQSPPIKNLKLSKGKRNLLARQQIQTASWEACKIGWRAPTASIRASLSSSSHFRPRAIPDPIRSLRNWKKSRRPMTLKKPLKQSASKTSARPQRTPS